MSDPGKRRHGAGWYVGAGLFWLLAAWIIASGLSSIIPQIFWPEEYASDAAGVSAGDCGPAVRALRDELLARTTRALETPAPPDDDWSRSSSSSALRTTVAPPASSSPWTHSIPGTSTT